MARFGPRADGPQIFGPGQAGPIYKRRTGPKWADGPLKNRPDSSTQVYNCLVPI